MADEKEHYEDEYQFADLDELNPEYLNEESLGEGEPFSVENAPPEETSKFGGGGTKDIRRNALIAIGVIIGLMFFYKLWVWVFSKPTPTKMATVPPIKKVVAPSSTPAPSPEVVAPTAPAPTVQQAAPEITQRLSALEAGQQTMRAEIDTINTQMSTMNSNLSDLTTKINELNQIMTNLATKLDQQANQLTLLTVRPRPKSVPQRLIPRAVPSLVYYIQAVIPGRAWLIATNGATLTVREGTRIPGYGVVKLIDARDGRVIMSSGRVIRFSQQDS